MGIFQLLFSSFVHTTLYLTLYHANGIVMLYLAHKYKKKLQSTNMGLSIIFLLACRVRGYGSSNINNIVIPP